MLYSSTCRRGSDPKPKTIGMMTMKMMCTLLLLPLLFVTAWSLSVEPIKGFTGVRIALYPKVKGDESLKAAIKTAVAGLSDLGVEVRPDDVSSAILGPEPALFEATRAVFGRACRVEGEPHVAMVCTFSAGCPGEEPDQLSPLPPRTVGDVWIEDALQLPSRIACQFAVYPLGSGDYMSTIYAVIDHAKTSPVYKDGIKTHFCSMLDGDGAEVFDVLQSSFSLARRWHVESGGNGHVTLTATLTANKAAWKTN
jgi:uncharacterized protein YqgV (UPF0045/DUF77 family)